MEPVVALLASCPDNASLLRNATWTLSNLCKGDPPAQLDFLAAGIPALAKALIESEDRTVVNDICWGLSYFTQSGEEEKLACLTQTGVVPRILQLTEHAEVSISTPCVRIVGTQRGFCCGVGPRIR